MPRRKTALLFPGQGPGSVHHGMGKKLMKSPEARKIFFQIGKSLDVDITSLCVYASTEELRHTQKSQIASLATNLGHAAVLKERGEKAFEDPETRFAGNSIGELAAAVVAGAIRLQDAPFIAAERGRLMHEACEENPGKMLVGFNREPIDIEEIENLCKGSDGVAISNYNSPTQIIIDGPVREVDAVAAEIKERGLVRHFSELITGGPYHNKKCMKPAVERFKKFLKGFTISNPQWLIVGNQGQPITTANGLRQELENGIANPVLWWMRRRDGQEKGVIPTLMNMGVERYLEVGAGDVLKKLLGTPTRKKIAGVVGGVIFVGATAGSGIYLATRSRNEEKELE
jgi:malonyl CoA-acyl carrier protein transacylase